MTAATHKRDATAEAARLAAMLATLDDADPARSLARQLLQAVLQLHAQGLAQLLALLREAGNQPSDRLLPRLCVNPAVRSLLLLHDLHPEDLTARAAQAVARLRPRLGVEAELTRVEQGVLHLRLHAAPPERPTLSEEIEAELFEHAPDAAGVCIEQSPAPPVREVCVPLSALGGRARA